jgi:hypothetical protein
LKLIIASNVADQHHFDADPDPYPAIHTDADPNPTFQFDPYPDPATRFFPNLDPSMLQNDPLRLPSFHLDTDTDSDAAFGSSFPL